MSAATPLVHVDLTDSVGALQIGSLFSIFLFGIVTLQAYIYYTTFRQDRWGYKTLVGAVWLLEIGHTIAVSYEVYRATITLYGKPQLLLTFPALSSGIAIAGAITTLVQCFFALRLFRVLPKPYAYIGIFCMSLSSIRFVGSVYLSYRAVTSKSVQDYRENNSWLVTTLLSTGASIDVIIAVSMLYYLSKKRSQAFERIATVIDRLIAYTVRTGLLTSVAAVVLLICYQAMPNNLVWLALYTSLAKLYSNSLLASLNSRQELREASSTSMPSLDRFSRGRSSRGGNNTARVELAPQTISIEMKTTMETTQDDSFDQSIRSYGGHSLLRNGCVSFSFTISATAILTFCEDAAAHSHYESRSTVSDSGISSQAEARAGYSLERSLSTSSHIERARMRTHDALSVPNPVEAGNGEPDHGVRQPNQVQELQEHISPLVEHAVLPERELARVYFGIEQINGRFLSILHEHSISRMLPHKKLEAGEHDLWDVRLAVKASLDKGEDHVDSI
ncbi:unnamed protein product [Cyclocybe aegerita]|uniref:DUF6534 domain-containing protein n=1 Tax=Cyclocybe aegerita TaxID=1973307 RepID=A0A8S0VVB7_CYCAE|nr:unnamed protein product [Cyclocybe aegerita]